MPEPPWLNVKDSDDVVHLVMMRPSDVNFGKTRCQRVFRTWSSIRGGVIRMQGTEEKASCIACLGHWSCT